MTDEAQEFKDQNLRSEALKTLKAIFKIVATGTPVENRLLNLWNLIDYIQPGSLLGSSKDFSKRYEQGLEEKSDSERTALACELRGRLRHDKPNAVILRREKAQCLTDLPEKSERVVQSRLSETQRKMHINLVQSIAAQPDDQPHPFELLDYLRKLYLHPSLLHQTDSADRVADAIAASPKLQSVVDVLRTIKAQKEKVLIFAITQRLQDLLKWVFDELFDLDVQIINGSAKSGGGSKADYRQRLIDSFYAEDGFNILLLSPKVAGVGLTITEANHVIHYERWWNPAKEAQATDRVYRIGQTKPVTVYYPISVDPLGEFTSFDQKLDSLLKEKKALAKDFLTPSTGMNLTDEEMFSGLADSRMAGANADTAESNPVDILELDGNQLAKLLSLLYQKQGYSVLQTAEDRLYGVDLIALSKQSVLLIHCNLDKSESDISIETLEDLQEAERFFQSALSLPVGKPPKVSRCYCTNVKFSKATRLAAKKQRVPLIEERELKKLLRKYRPTITELITTKSPKSGSCENLLESIRSILINYQPKAHRAQLPRR